MVRGLSTRRRGGSATTAWTELGGSVLLHSPAGPDPLVLERCADLAARHEPTLVFLDLPPMAGVRDRAAVAACLAGRPGELRLVPVGRDRSAAATLAEWLSHLLGRSVLAPDGDASEVADGWFVPTTAGAGWTRYEPGHVPVAHSRRLPTPAWEGRAFAEPRDLGGGVRVEPLPAGVWITGPGAPQAADSLRKWLTGGLQMDPGHPRVVVGHPGPASVPLEAVRDFWAQLDERTRPAVRFAEFGATDLASPTAGPDSADPIGAGEPDPTSESFGQALADLLGTPVVAATGVPVLAPWGSGGSRVRVLLPNGAMHWRPYVWDLRYLPREEGKTHDPEPVGYRSPIEGLAELASGVYEYAPDAVLEVTRSGLWMRPPEPPRDASAVRNAPIEPGRSRVFHAATTSAHVADRMRRLAAEVLPRLEAEVRKLAEVLPSTAAITLIRAAADPATAGAVAAWEADAAVAEAAAVVEDEASEAPALAVADIEDIAAPPIEIPAPTEPHLSAKHLAGVTLEVSALLASAPPVSAPQIESPIGSEQPAEAALDVAAELVSAPLVSGPPLIEPAVGAEQVAGAALEVAAELISAPPLVEPTVSPEQPAGAALDVAAELISAPALVEPTVSPELPSAMPVSAPLIESPIGSEQPAEAALDVAADQVSPQPQTELAVSAELASAPPVSMPLIEPAVSSDQPAEAVLDTAAEQVSALPQTELVISAELASAPPVSMPLIEPAVSSEQVSAPPAEPTISSEQPALEVAAELAPALPAESLPGSEQPAEASPEPDADPAPEAASETAPEVAADPPPAPPLSVPPPIGRFSLESGPPTLAIPLATVAAQPVIAADPVAPAAPLAPGHAIASTQVVAPPPAATPIPAPDPVRLPTTPALTPTLTPAPTPAPAAPTSAGPTPATQAPATPAPSPVPKPSAAPRTGARVQPVPSPENTAVPPARSLDLERQWLRRNLAGQYDATVGSVARILSEFPGLRAGGAPTADVLVDLVAVQLYLSGHTRGFDDLVRSGAAGPHVPLARCIASGLRRLPSHRGPVLVRAELSERELRWYGGRKVVTEWAFAPCVTGGRLRLPGAVEVLIWSMTARRTHLVAPEHPDQAVFLPGTSFKVLSATEGEDGPRVLLRELSASEVGADGRVEPGRVPLDDVALAGLPEAGERWRQEEAQEELPASLRGRFGSPPGLIVIDPSGTKKDGTQKDGTQKVGTNKDGTGKADTNRPPATTPEGTAS